MRNTFFITSEQPEIYTSWSCQKCLMLSITFLDNIFIRFGSELYGQIVGIPMGKNCAPLFTDLFLFCYERDFMLYFYRSNIALDLQFMQIFTNQKYS